MDGVARRLAGSPEEADGPDPEDPEPLMNPFRFQPPRIVEESGDGWFVAPHPEPLASEPPILEKFLGARYSLIGNWSEDSYLSEVFTFDILRRRVVVVNAPEWIKYVLVTKAAVFERKSPQMRRALEILLGDGLFISDGDTWKRRRPLVSDIVHKNRVPVFGRTMEEVAQSMADGWAARGPDHRFELTAAMAELTAEIISRTVFGNGLGPDAARRVIDGFTGYQRLVDSFNLGYFFGWDEGWPLIAGPRRRRAVAMVHGVVEEVIERHLAGGGDEGSMIDLLVRRARRNPELGLDMAALRNEAATIFMAGHETTATTLTWALYCVARSPHVEAAILEELARVCPDRAPTVGDIEALPWCRATIDETLRLYPPVPLMPRQAREADEIAGHRVAAGDLVMIAPWLTHRARDQWERPNHFDPARFLGDAQVNPFVYFPFAVGPRVCPGMNFGHVEAVLCLATLLQRFRIAPPPEFRAHPVCRLTMRPLDGIPVTAVPRASSEAAAA